MAPRAFLALLFTHLLVPALQKSLFSPSPNGRFPRYSAVWCLLINGMSGCHDIRLADMDGDRKLDVVCSASMTLGTGSFVVFQNNHNDWEVVNDVATLGDGVDVIAIAGSNSPHLVGANVADGNIYWYQ